MVAIFYEGVGNADLGCGLGQATALDEAMGFLAFAQARIQGQSSANRSNEKIANMSVAMDASRDCLTLVILNPYS